MHLGFCKANSIKYGTDKTKLFLSREWHFCINGVQYSIIKGSITRATLELAI